MTTLKKLIIIAAIYKTFLLVSSLLLDYLYEDFDRSADLLVDYDILSSWQQFIYQLTKVHLRWDSLFYVQIAHDGYINDKNHAFFPLFPLILRTVSLPFQWIMPRILAIMVGGYVFNSMVYFWLVCLVHRITLQLASPQIAIYSTLLFIFNPSSIFYHVLYTECLFCLPVFLCIDTYLSTYHHISVSRSVLSLRQSLTMLYLPSLYLVMAVLIRSNGLFFLSVPAVVLLKYLIILKSQPKPAYFQIIMSLSMGLIILIQCLGIYIWIVSVYPSSLYCVYSPASWCQQDIPNVYSYIQKEHWKVGWLCSYESKRALDIFWGVQSLVLVAWGLLSFLMHCYSSYQSLPYRDQTILQFMSSLWLSTLVLFLVAGLVAHIQSSTRFFSSSLFFYWFLAHEIDRGTSLSKVVPIYLSLFNCAGLVLFSNFLAWV